MQAILLCQFLELLCKTQHCVNWCNRYIHLHCLQQIQLHPSTLYLSYLYSLQQAQLSTLSTIGTTIFTVSSRYNYLHCQQQVQLSTLSTVGTAVYTVCNRYSYLHCQWVKLSTLSTISTACSRYNYLHCQQQVQLSILSAIGTAIYTVNG